MTKEREFVGDVHGAPKDVLPRELLDEVDHVHRDRRSTDLSSRSLSPGVGEASAVPTDHGLTIEPNQIRRAVWAAVSCEYGYLPQVPGRIFILSLSRRILCHPYDSRGMDIVSPSRENLQELYRVHSDWLLDGDREKMDEIFGA